jgi:hypothetical protein
MKYKHLTVILLTFYFTCACAQTKSMRPDLLKGKWKLTRYTETFDGETYNRPIAGVKNYEPKIDSSYKEMNQGDTVSVYEFKSDNTYTLSAKNGFGVVKVIGKWRTSDKDSIVTLYDMQTFTSKGPLEKSKNTYDLKVFSLGELFLVLSSYDSGLNSTHKLYYKKTKTN